MHDTAPCLDRHGHVVSRVLPLRKRHFAANLYSPEMRDLIITKVDWTKFEKYRNLSAKSLSVNWKYTDSGAFLESPDGQNLVLNPLFESHIRKRENWSIGPEVGEEFPVLAGFCVQG